MISGRNKGKHNKKTLAGMSNLQILFQDKEHLLRGLTKEEVISLYYHIPLKKVMKMDNKTKETKWHEITTIKKYLRNNGLCAIDYQSLDKNTPISNEEFGIRTFDRRRNVFFRVTKQDTAGDIASRYKKTADSFNKASKKIVEIAEELENEQPVLEQMQTITQKQFQ